MTSVMGSVSSQCRRKMNALIAVKAHCELEMRMLITRYPYSSRILVAEHHLCEHKTLSFVVATSMIRSSSLHCHSIYTTSLHRSRHIAEPQCSYKRPSKRKISTTSSTIVFIGFNALCSTFSQFQVALEALA